MNIEIVEFYETFRDDQKGILKGTLHIYLPDLQLDIRGVHVSKRKNSWFFRIPHQSTLDSETNQRVFYPVISFIDKEKNIKLMNAIIERGKKYVEGACLQERTRKFG